MNAPSPQSSPLAGRGGVYLKIELKFQISLVSIYRSCGQFHSGIQGVGKKQNAKQDAIVAKMLEAIAG